MDIKNRIVYLELGTLKIIMKWNDLTFYIQSFLIHRFFVFIIFNLYYLSYFMLCEI